MKKFYQLLVKCVNPSYSGELARQDMWLSFKFFVKLLLLCFFIMAVVAIPKIYFIQADMKKSALDVAKFTLDLKLETLAPISLPEYSPFLTIDTTNNKTWGEEWFFISGSSISYRAFGKNTTMLLQAFDFGKNKESSVKIFERALIIALPGLFSWYYIIYFLKYMAIILIAALVAYPVSKIFQNHTSFKQMVVLGFYTISPMVFLEILTIPFFVKKFLITYSPIIGVNFSAIPAAIFLVLFVTAIRLNGNRSLE